MRGHSEADAAAAERIFGEPVARGAQITWLNDMIIARQDHRAIPCTLPQPTAFSDRQVPEDLKRLFPDYDPEATGAAAPVLHWRVASSCAGYARKASGGELYEALHAENPTIRQKALVSMWVNEATDSEIVRGLAQQAYTLRDLVSAMHRSDCTRNWERNRFLCRCAT